MHTLRILVSTISLHANVGSRKLRKGCCTRRLHSRGKVTCEHFGNLDIYFSKQTMKPNTLTFTFAYFCQIIWIYRHANMFRTDYMIVSPTMTAMSIWRKHQLFALGSEFQEVMHASKVYLFIYMLSLLVFEVGSGSIRNGLLRSDRLW